MRDIGSGITVAIANFKVSSGVVPGQHVYTGELVLGHTHIESHTVQVLHVRRHNHCFLGREHMLIHTPPRVHWSYQWSL